MTAGLGRSALLVAAGGTLGSAARIGIGLLLPASGGMPWATLTVNLVGAFVLGALLEVLRRRGPDEGRRRALRLAAGTGFCGGFTTYSAFAVESVRLLESAPVLGVVYILATLLAGAAATLAGFGLGGWMHGRTERRRPA
ncbi:fluoride efflux transporter FluC [Agromyces archimandritae]|uniref:Fluoride-specific ion channel FluC n=1 Tax=Agromyces archimandritae TaxID=2781962 RepID=A0A975IRE5_9MICO|nr:CrcB family protein [Agromyces archimandritae]QTX06006.1 CrcB family protein [Agromyces archimandritae]